MKDKKNFNEDLLEDWYEKDGIYYVPFNRYDQPIIPKAHIKNAEADLNMMEIELEKK